MRIVLSNQFLSMKRNDARSHTVENLVKSSLLAGGSRGTAGVKRQYSNLRRPRSYAAGSARSNSRIPCDPGTPYPLTSPSNLFSTSRPDRSLVGDARTPATGGRENSAPGVRAPRRRRLRTRTTRRAAAVETIWSHPPAGGANQSCLAQSKISLKFQLAIVWTFHLRIGH